MARTEWEYSARTAHEVVEALNLWGREGWELCGQIQHPEHGVVFLLKRPRLLIETDTSLAPRDLQQTSP